MSYTLLSLLTYWLITSFSFCRETEGFGQAWCVLSNVDGIYFFILGCIQDFQCLYKFLWLATIHIFCSLFTYKYYSSYLSCQCLNICTRNRVHRTLVSLFLAVRHATRLNHGFRIALTVQIRSYKEHKNWEQRSFEIMESPSREIIQEKERHIKLIDERFELLTVLVY